MRKEENKNEKKGKATNKVGGNVELTVSDSDLQCSSARWWRLWTERKFILGGHDNGTWLRFTPMLQTQTNVYGGCHEQVKRERETQKRDKREKREKKTTKKKRRWMRRRQHVVNKWFNKKKRKTDKRAMERISPRIAVCVLDVSEVLGVIREIVVIFSHSVERISTIKTCQESCGKASFVVEFYNISDQTCFK